MQVITYRGMNKKLISNIMNMIKLLVVTIYANTTNS